MQPQHENEPFGSNTSIEVKWLCIECWKPVNNEKGNICDNCLLLILHGNDDQIVREDGNVTADKLV